VRTLVRDPVTNVNRLASRVVVLSGVPSVALASSGSDGPWGAALPATTLLGVVAALAWHHLAGRRERIVSRWQQMHLGDRLPVLRLGERLHRLHVRDAILDALHLRGGAAATAVAEQPRRVLVVDDDADVRTAIAEVLSVEGFSVTEAADGFEGLRRAREEHPDVILLDLLMPRMDGYGFRAEQRADAALADIPVVVISGADESKAGELGAAAFLHKPFDLRVLVDAVGRHAVAAA
jgi:CheY-like chemotaxis protein